ELIMLSVDDDLWCVRLAAMLGEHGLTAHCANDLERTSLLLDERVYDLVLVSIGMENQGGLELVRRVREGEGIFGTPIVFVAPRPTLATAVDAVQLAAVDYVAKPRDPADIVGAVTVALTRARATRVLRATQ